MTLVIYKNLELENDGRVLLQFYDLLQTSILAIFGSFIKMVIAVETGRYKMVHGFRFFYSKMLIS